MYVRNARAGGVLISYSSFFFLRCFIHQLAVQTDLAVMSVWKIHTTEVSAVDGSKLHPAFT